MLQDNLDACDWKCPATERPRTATPRLPFDKFWKALELTWLYEPFFLSVRRYVFDSDSHRGVRWSRTTWQYTGLRRPHDTAACVNGALCHGDHPCSIAGYTGNEHSRPFG